MAINYITVDREKSLGNQTIAIVNTLREYQDKLRQLKEIMDNMTDGTDYTKIEAQFGLVTGKGQPLYNLVAGATSELAVDSNFVNLIDWTVPLV